MKGYYKVVSPSGRKVRADRIFDFLKINEQHCFKGYFLQKGAKCYLMAKPDNTHHLFGSAIPASVKDSGCFDHIGIFRIRRSFDFDRIHNCHYVL